MLDRTVAPPSGAIANPGIKEPDHIVLSNGSPVYTINAGDQPVVKLEILLKSGIWNEHLPGISWIVAKMLPEGSTGKTAQKVAELFEFYGSFVEVNPGFDNTSIAVYTPQKYVEEVVNLLAEIIFNPAFREEELEILKTNKIQQLKVNSEKTSFVSSRKIREALFGLDHPYGRSLSEQNVKALQRQDILTYYESSFWQAPEFLLSGMVTDKEVEIIRRYFDMPLRKTSPSKNIPTQAKSTKSIFIEKPESVQSSIRLSWEIPGKSHSDHFGLMVLNEILGGYFSSRLMKNLREDKGYTYGVHSYPVFLQHDSFLIISADVIAEATQDAIEEIHKEVDILQHNLIDNSELETVRNYMAGAFLSSISSPFQLMEKFKSLHSHKLNYDYFDRFFQTLKNITPEELRHLAGKYFETEGLHTVVVGKK